MARNNPPPTLQALYDQNKSETSKRYELFRRKIRRLEQGNERTILNLAKAAGLIEDDDEREHSESGESNLG